VNDFEYFWKVDLHLEGAALPGLVRTLVADEWYIAMTRHSRRSTTK